MAQPSFWDDNRRAQEVIRERTELSRLVTRVKELTTKAEDLTVLLELAEEATDGSLDAEIADGVAGLRKELDEYELKIMLSGPARHEGRDRVDPSRRRAAPSPRTGRRCCCECTCAGASATGLKAEVVDLLPGDEAGIKSATVEVSGEYAFGYLRGETGVHRLVRISPFDASRRRQTSFASVAVVPEVDDVEINVREDELRVDVFRASGPGGQGVNTADSAVRITHLPTGIVVSCQNERSQLRNRDTAMRILKARLYEIAEKKQREQLAELTGHKKEIAFGSQIRSYTFHPYQLIKDHRTGLEVGNVEGVMDGDLDALHQGLPALGAGPRGMNHDDNELMRQRRDKLEALRRRGLDPFGGRYPVTHWARGLAERLGERRATSELKGFGPVSLAGRIVAMRHHGKTCFAHLMDQTGRIQLYARADGLGDEYARFVELDTGDFVGVTGEMFRTRTGELTVAVKTFSVPRQVAAAAPREVARPEGRRDALPAALRRSHRQRRVARDLHDARAARPGDPRVPRRARVPRGRDADDAADPRRRDRPAVQDPSQRARTWISTCASRPSSISSGCWSAASSGSTRSTGTSATRGPRRCTTPSSRRSSSTRRTPTTRT